MSSHDGEDAALVVVLPFDCTADLGTSGHDARHR